MRNESLGVGHLQLSQCPKCHVVHFFLARCILVFYLAERSQ